MLVSNQDFQFNNIAIIDPVAIDTVSENSDILSRSVLPSYYKSSLLSALKSQIQIIESPMIGVDTKKKIVYLDHDLSCSYDNLVIGTGLGPATILETRGILSSVVRWLCYIPTIHKR